MTTVGRNNNSRYTVQVIDRYSAFEKLKTEWEKLYSSDPYGHLYVSWLWLSVYYQHTSTKWMVLAVFDPILKVYAGFLPLTVNKAKPKKLQPVTTLFLGAEPYSIFNGIVCRTEDEKVLAIFIQTEIKWDRFLLKRLVNERLVSFVDLFDEKKFKRRFFPEWPALQINLPDSYAQYLKENLGKSTRPNLRNRANRLNKKSEITITDANDETIEEDIRILFTMWEKRFGVIPKVTYEREVLLRFFKNNKLFLFVYWDGVNPISAYACIPDDNHKTMISYIIAYDSKYGEFSPGMLINLHAINRAIQKGMRKFDFLMGGDSYKRSLGGIERTVKHVEIHRRDPKTNLTLATGKLSAGIKKTVRKIGKKTS